MFIAAPRPLLPDANIIKILEPTDLGWGASAAFQKCTSTLKGYLSHTYRRHNIPQSRTHPAIFRHWDPVCCNWTLSLDRLDRHQCCNGIHRQHDSLREQHTTHRPTFQKCSKIGVKGLTVVARRACLASISRWIPHGLSLHETEPFEYYDMGCDSKFSIWGDST